MSSYGEIRLRLQQLVPGTAIEMLDGWIGDTYTKLLDRIPWKRMESEFVIQVPRSYNTGTVDVEQGSADIVGNGTTWLASMDGLAIRFNNEAHYYQITVDNATTAHLDRPYEGIDATALAYRIDQNVYLLPSNARILNGVKPLHDRVRPLEVLTPAGLDRKTIDRNAYGTPRYYIPTWDNFSNPPRLQVELYPIPDCPSPTNGEILSFALDIVTDATQLDPEATSFSLLPWVRPSAIIAGVQSACDRWRASQSPEKASAFLASAGAHEAEYEKLAAAMEMVNAFQQGPQTIRLAKHLQVQRRRQFSRSVHVPQD